MAIQMNQAQSQNSDKLSSQTVQNPKNVSAITFVNVCIHDFDDVKEESNKAASNDKHLLQE